MCLSHKFHFGFFMKPVMFNGFGFSGKNPLGQKLRDQRLPEANSGVGSLFLSSLVLLKH